MERDLQLDIYRALSILYVVCVTHVIYWLHIGKEPIMSILLFEMPVIFFISGASLSVSKPKPFLSVLKSRIKRVVIPFYIYAFVMVCIIAVLSFIWPYLHTVLLNKVGEKAANFFSFDISTYSWIHIRSILLLGDVPQSPLSWHLWFVLPYFLLSLLFVPQRFIIDRYGKWGGVIFSASFYILLYFTDVKGMWRTMAAYNIFMVAGYLFFRRLSFKYLSIYAVLLALLVGFLMIYGYTFTPMQDNKIELNPLFVAYGLFALCVLGILLHKINIPAYKVFEVFNKRGYTIYLYQNIAFCGASAKPCVCK